MLPGCLPLGLGEQQKNAAGGAGPPKGPSSRPELSLQYGGQQVRPSAATSKNGRAHHTRFARHWGGYAGAPDRSTRTASRIVAPAYADAQAAHAGDHRAREQNGADRMDAAHAQ